MFFVRGMDVKRAHYNMKHYGKHDILLLDACLLYLYFTPHWLGQYLVTYHNNITEIYIAVDHDVEN